MSGDPPGTALPGTRPLPAAFAAAMAAFPRFEPAPRIAVAVSGGADSLALCLLAADWAGAQGGAVTALTVDHRLRPDSGREAARVGAILAARGIAHRVLVRDGDRPVTAIQAEARAARYALLGRWCREAGVLHLLIGHHARDQAETVLLRALSGTASGGLAGMQALVETSYGRILRPLLAEAPERLRAWLRHQGLAWIDDPGNVDPAFARNRLRRLAVSMAAAGLDAGRINEVAALAAEARRTTDQAASALLAAAVTLHPGGFARVDRQALADQPAFVRRRALQRLLACIGGRRWQPGDRGIDRIVQALGARSPVALTLGGCQIRDEGPADRAGEWILVCREARNLPPPCPLAAVGRDGGSWDGRFSVRAASWPASAGPGPRLEALGVARAEALAGLLRRQDQRASLDRGIPRPAWPALPCLAEAPAGDGRPDPGPDLAALIAVPHLRYWRDAWPPPPAGGVDFRFRPRWPLSGGGHFPVCP